MLTYPAKAKLLIVGSGQIAAPLSAFAQALDFSVTILEPREAFIPKDELTGLDVELLRVWPEKYFRTLEYYDNLFAVLLSHDPKIDDPLFPYLLRNTIRYVGALGGSKTNEKRRARLAATGFSEAEIARIHAPVGVSINSLTAPEIALSIIAQVIAVKNTPSL